MAYSNKDISSLIVDFLSKTIDQKIVSEDSADSLNVAIDCITEAFEFERDSVASTVSTKFGGKSLPALLEQFSKGAQFATEETIKVNIPVEDAATKAKAESLKLEGNKAMAMRDFESAIEKYTEAINALPTNAIYYANRAAAHSSLKQYEDAINDAEEAINIDPAYSKGYSRLAFAKYAQDKPEEALDAYKKVLDIEGDKATDVMKRDYEAAKKKVEQSLNLEKVSPTDTVTRDAPEVSDAANSNPLAGGMPDMASMLGGGLGGLLNNPQLMQAAQQMMSDPNSMSKIQSMMQNPAVRQMAENFGSGSGSGGMPNLDDLMNNPALRSMASNLFGGAGNPGAENGNSEESTD